jgi:hypothetical protein
MRSNAPPRAAALYGCGLVLVRPDGHVAWRGDRQPDATLSLIDTVRGATLAQPDPAAAFLKRARGRLGANHTLEY